MAEYSPEVQDYIDRLNALSSDMSLKGYYLPNDYKSWGEMEQLPASDGWEYVTHDPDESVYQRMMSSGAPLESYYSMPLNYYGDSRMPGAMDIAQLGYGQNYTFTDKASGKSYTTSSPEDVAALKQYIGGITGGGNNTSNWEITDASGNRVAWDSPYTPSFLKQAGQFIADQAPTVLGSMIAGPIGGALGSMAGTGIRGGDFLDALKSGLLSYGASVGTSMLGNAVFPSGTGSSLIDNTLNIGNGDVWGWDRFTNSFGSPAPTFGGPPSPTAAPTSVSGDATYGGLPVESAVVSATRPSFSGLYGGSLIPASYTSPSQNDRGVENATVTGYRPDPNSALGIMLGLGAGGGALSAGLGAGSAPGVESATVSATRPSPYSITAPDIAAAAGAGGLGALAATPDVGGSGPSNVDKAISAAKAAALLSSLFGAAGSGSGSKTWSPSLMNKQQLPDTFSAKLPTAGGPSSDRTVVNHDEDWNTYGSRPELNFFSDVPARRARGGSAPHAAPSSPRPSFAVKGDGDGRSDSIPAALSDGEYVMDAETVAMLGNGSNKAGAQKLDQFRVNLRKHKGQKLAKGKFSLAAKEPQSYMPKGK